MPSGLIWACRNIVQYITVNSTCTFPGPKTYHALPNTTSFFFGKGKNFSWNTWKLFTDMTEAFMFLYKLTEDHSIVKPLEWLTVVLYTKLSNEFNVHETSKEIFSNKNGTRWNIPDTQEIWVRKILLMVSSLVGWDKSNMNSWWHPVWMSPVYIISTVIMKCKEYPSSLLVSDRILTDYKQFWNMVTKSVTKWVACHPPPPFPDNRITWHLS